MTQTIDKRAKAYANFITGYSPFDRWYEAIKDYTKGATEQRDIDDGERDKQRLFYTL